MLSSMENHIKHKITRIFRSSFGSCKTKNITDVIDDKPVFHPQNPQLFSDLFPPKPRPFPSICRPKLPAAAEVDHRILFPRAKISDQSSPLFPPASAASPSKHKIAPRKKKKKKTTRAHIRRLDFDDFHAFGYKGLFSSDEETEDEDDEDDDRATRRRRAERIRRRRRRAARKRRGAEEGMKDSLAVVKRSRDPCADFRASMLEMIMEKQIFGAKDLEKLLDCFLSLNSHHHHGVIIQVFTEICEALFSNYCP
ncbi:PREDICTED: transcription repressor OFP8-like isoform X2 [Ipomoea nil]|uniref:transcription repressor OFP8-like isoform X2 n=1 Tax=Ipomoea nil TaxID=35883 RepID=UPI000901ED83|nr:PREDICTED: transcription repressor OFP8-like isoform X2 [Ipomoea nil]